jgi:NAD(P)-dependent dehydrogenase (short-subunit alcohol dehydrogenase family)
MKVQPVGPMGLLDDKLCIVTGAGSGLGAAVSREFAAEGARVVLLDRDAGGLAATRGAIEAQGGRATARVLDLTDFDLYAQAVADMAAREGQIDVLVNNAAINPPTWTILEDTPENWRRTLAVNLDAVWWGSKLVAPHMVAARSGRIIHVSSVQGFGSSGRTESYNAAKGALIALTKSMAVELGEHGILVNAVAPGYMQTPMSVVDGVAEHETPEFKEWYVQRGRIPLRRSARPEEVAGAVTFLASPLCRYMTGQVLVVDGGLTSTF